jgi:Fur family ferric uptake transcriptional regulator
MMYLTRQRKTILEELERVTSHPTADEIFGMVRRRLPSISLGTVYRNLELLTQGGLIQRIGGGKRMRYDAVVQDHLHVKCTGCQSVIDLPVESEVNVEAMREEMLHRCRSAANRAKMCDVLECRIEFLGLCEHCKAKARRRHA